MRDIKIPAVLLLLLVAGQVRAEDPERFFAHSYAVVVGIDHYRNAAWPTLTYAVDDAGAMAGYLRSEGFKVTELYDAQATRAAIIASLEDKLAPILGEDDRVLFFFAGHGTSRDLASGEQGFLVPVDGGDTGSFSSFIRLSELHDLSESMGAARHQLFILDSCFGGLAAMRGGAIETLDSRIPEYLYEVSRRKARELLTAGGKNQRVQDGGEGQHSKFTGQLLKAIQQGLADINGDGYVTFNELTAYIVPAATSYNQTPGVATMAGHELGEFWFKSHATAAPAVAHNGSPVRDPGADVYAAYVAGMVAYSKKDFVEARRQFIVAARAGNAEAMNFLGKLYWEGWGAPDGKADQTEARRWLQSGAERGNIQAISSLVNISSGEEKAKWMRALHEAENLQASISISDPTGHAGSAEPNIPRDSTIIRPMPPTNLTVQ